MVQFNRDAELALFKRLAGDPKLVEWVNWKLEVEKDKLVSVLEVDQIRKAQGRAQLLTSILLMMDVSSYPPK